MTRPAPTIAMRRRRRQDGTPFLVGTVAEQVVLEPGTELHLRKLNDGDLGDAPPYVLVCVQPVKPWREWTRAEKARAAEDRYDGCATRRDRRDRRDAEECAPW